MRQVALIVHGLIDATLWGTRPAVLTWAVWGLAMAAWNQLRPYPQPGAIDRLS